MENNTQRYEIRNESDNVWTGKLLNPERQSSGLKNIRIRVDEALESGNSFSLLRNLIIHLHQNVPSKLFKERKNVAIS